MLLRSVLWTCQSFVHHLVPVSIDDITKDAKRALHCWSEYLVVVMCMVGHCVVGWMSVVLL